MGGNATSEVETTIAEMISTESDGTVLENQESETGIRVENTGENQVVRLGMVLYRVM